VQRAAVPVGIDTGTVLATDSLEAHRVNVGASNAIAFDGVEAGDRRKTCPRHVAALDQLFWSVSGKAQAPVSTRAQLDPNRVSMRLWLRGG
jgi:hypothetical protein